MIGLNFQIALVILAYVVNNNTISCTHILSLPTMKFGREDCGSENLVAHMNHSMISALDSFVDELERSSNRLNYSRPILEMEAFGSIVGSYWDDNILTHNPIIVGIRVINISYGSRVNSIQVSYLLADGTVFTAPQRGHSSGNMIFVILASNKRVIRVEGMQDDSGISQLLFVIKNSSGVERNQGPYGSFVGTSFSIQGFNTWVQGTCQLCSSKSECVLSTSTSQDSNYWRGKSIVLDVLMII